VLAAIKLTVFSRLNMPATACGKSRERRGGSLVNQPNISGRAAPECGDLHAIVRRAT
jgi:hypothetical protein